MGAHVVDLAVLLVAAAGRGNKLAFTDPNSSHKATIYECVGDEDVLDLLLKHTDVNVTDEDGNSALHWCLRTCKGLCPQRMKSVTLLYKTIMSLLLNHGARANQKNNWGLTAVHFAAENGNSQAIQELLSKEPACINKKTEMKETPLYFAVKNDHKECVELLLRYGASTNILNLREEEEEEATLLKSWVDILRRGREKQPVSSLSQYPKQFMPLWLGVFRKWLPSFLRQVSSRTEEYALSSLKSDFRAAFGMDLDHLSLGYSKLANFIRCFPDLCQLEFIAIGKGKPRNHMILLPVLSEPTRRLFQSPTLPSSSSHHNSDNNAPVQEGICDDDESTEDHLPEVSSQNDESADTCINVGRNVNLDLHGDLASGHSWFIEFLKPDPMFQGRTWLQNALLQPRPEWKHMVLEFASREKNNHHQSTFFLREYDYYEVRE
ncbi:Cortactin-binding protein 2 [Linum perenne]